MRYHSEEDEMKQSYWNGHIRIHSTLFEIEDYIDTIIHYLNDRYENYGQYDYDHIEILSSSWVEKMYIIPAIYYGNKGHNYKEAKLLFYDFSLDKGKACPVSEVKRIFRLLSMKYKIEPPIRDNAFIFKTCKDCSNIVWDMEEEICEECKRHLVNKEKIEKITGVIYFLKDGFDGNYIKIGYSANLISRIKEFNCGNAGKQKILLTIPGNRKMEHQLHVKYAEQKHGLEWFKYEGRLKEYIDEHKNKQNY